jgi:hypothetical protein
LNDMFHDMHDFSPFLGLSERCKAKFVLNRTF